MVRTIEESTFHYARGAIRAYLEGKKTLNWVIGMIRSSGVRDRRLEELMNRLQGYGNQSRFMEVLSACREEGWIR